MHFKSEYRVSPNYFLPLVVAPLKRSFIFLIISATTAIKLCEMMLLTLFICGLQAQRRKASDSDILGFLFEPHGTVLSAKPSTPIIPNPVVASIPSIPTVVPSSTAIHNPSGGFSPKPKAAKPSPNVGGEIDGNTANNPIRPVVNPPQEPTIVSSPSNEPTTQDDSETNDTDTVSENSPNSNTTFLNGSGSWVVLPIIGALLILVIGAVLVKKRSQSFRTNLGTMGLENVSEQSSHSWFQTHSVNTPEEAQLPT